MLKLKLIVIAAIVLALAGTCAAWKWNAPTANASQTYRIAGWSWELATEGGVATSG